MALQFCDIALHSPFRWIKSTATPGVNYDDDWHLNLIEEFQQKKDYKQKWVVGDDTVQQVVSTIAPGKLEIYNCKQVKVDELDFDEILTASSGNVYHCEINLDDAYDSGANPVLYLYFKCQVLDTVFQWISEPIHVAAKWPNTSVFRYKNSVNAHGGVFVNTDLEMKFRCEARIMFEKGEAESNEFVDEIHDTKLVSATPHREFRMEVGTASGVARWVQEKLNWIINMDTWYCNDKRFAKKKGAKWEINSQRGYPLIGAGIDIMERFNLTALQQSEGSVVPGIVTGFIIDSEFTGTAQEIFVEEITIETD